MIHQVKCKSNYYEQIVNQNKEFEVRKSDRNFKVGEFLGINEIDRKGKETRRCVVCKINYILDDREYCKEGYVILGIKLIVNLYQDYGYIVI